MPSPHPAQPSAGPLPAVLHGVLEPLVTEAGFDLDEVDVRPTGRRNTVKVVVDSDHGVGLDDIARLSRAAAAELERHEHLIGDSYTLEFTSPGLDRPLTAPRHWRRARLRLVAVRPVEGEAFTGRVGVAGDDAVTLLVHGALRPVRYLDIAHAVIEVEFASPPDAEIALLGETP